MQSSRKKVASIAGALALISMTAMTAALPGAAQAADAWPAQPVRIIVPYAPGGGTDTIARITAKLLGDQLNKSFVVENKPGGTGILGNSFVAKAAPDGHTLLLADITFPMLPATNKSLPYDVLKDFTVITQLDRVPQALVVIPSLGAGTLKEFIALARANPGKFNFGSGGSGSAPHLSAEFFNMAAKVKIAHIPFKGAGDVITAMLAGEVQMLITSIPGVLAQVRAGKLRALAITTDGRRAPPLPDVPTTREAGLPGMDIDVWHGLVGPAGMAREVVNRLHTEIAAGIAQTAVQTQFTAQGAEPLATRPEDFAKFVRGEMQRWEELVKTAGIKTE